MSDKDAGGGADLFTKIVSKLIEKTPQKWRPLVIIIVAVVVLVVAGYIFLPQAKRAFSDGGGSHDEKPNQQQVIIIWPPMPSPVPLPPVTPTDRKLRKPPETPEPPMIVARNGPTTNGEHETSAGISTPAPIPSPTPHTPTPISPPPTPTPPPSSSQNLSVEWEGLVTNISSLNADFKGITVSRPARLALVIQSLKVLYNYDVQEDRKNVSPGTPETFHAVIGRTGTPCQYKIYVKEDFSGNAGTYKRKDLVPLIELGTIDWPPPDGTTEIRKIVH